MKWRDSSNPRLAEAIVDSFRSSPEHSRRWLSRFTVADWQRTEFWLDASGLALYFIRRIESLGIEEAVNTALTLRLRSKLDKNQNKTSVMMEEFVALNNIFQANGLQYANLKGFTLSPDSCPDPTLRHQLDLDFLLAPRHRETCREILVARGYSLVAMTPQTWEFKTRSSQASSINGHYDATQRLCVELHFTPDSTDVQQEQHDARLDRLGTWTCKNGTFPALSPADQLVGQALHILSHLRGEHSRPSWFLEFRHHVLLHQGDDAFWLQVRLLAQTHQHGATALGISILIASDLFGAFSSPSLDEWTTDTLSIGVRLWCKQYGRQAVLADFPGTKLFLLLEKELICGTREQHTSSLKRLLPIHSVPRVLEVTLEDTLLSRIHKEVVQLRFILFRLRFHMVEGVRYVLEYIRWKKLLRDKSSHNINKPENRLTSHKQ
jgi:hypothetical protein